MNIRLGGMVAFLLCALPFLAGLDGSACEQDAEKNTVKALFDGVPADLRTKVRNNPVRCDRVNDWLKEQVNGKGKTVEIRVGVQSVYTNRSKDGTYVVHIDLKNAPVYLLGDEWMVSFGDGGFSSSRISFMGVKTADAEKLVEVKQILIHGRVKSVMISRQNSFRGETSSISIPLEDVQVDGNKWAPYLDERTGGVVGGGKNKGKKGGTPDDTKGKKGGTPDDKKLPQ